MHELSIATALVEQAMEYAEKEGATHVTSLTVRLGAFSGVEGEALLFAFPMAAEGTPVEGATLEIDQEPMRALCKDCGKASEADARVACCLHCGSAALKLDGSRDMLLVSLTLDAPA